MQWHTFNFQGQCMFLLAEQTPNLTCSCIQFTDRYSPPVMLCFRETLQLALFRASLFHRLAGECWLMLIYYERKLLLVRWNMWLMLMWCERKVPLVGGWKAKLICHLNALPKGESAFWENNCTVGLLTKKKWACDFAWTSNFIERC
jgi:hypothetical protein